MYELRECHECVEDEDGLDAPCDRPAVGWRVEPEENMPYPVCIRHHRWPYADEWVAAIVAAERNRLAWLSARRGRGEARCEVDVWRRLAKGATDAEEDE